MVSNEQGSGTVLAAGVAMAMLLLTVMVLGLGKATTAAARAATAADLSALAAADVHRGLAGGEACQVAAEVAAIHGALLVECIASGDLSVQVTVTVETALPWPAEGRSRAGRPPDSIDPGG